MSDDADKTAELGGELVRYLQAKKVPPHEMAVALIVALGVVSADSNPDVRTGAEFRTRLGFIRVFVQCFDAGFDGARWAVLA